MSTKDQLKQDSSKMKNEASTKNDGPSNDAQREKKMKIDEVKSLKNKLKKSGMEARELKAELQNLKEDYLRQLADKENLRKRLEREKNEFYQHSLGEVFLEMLAILDNFERALKSDIQDVDQSLRDGVELIYKQILALLEKRGVKQIDLQDNKFDPRFHQAFTTSPSPDVKEPRIAEEYQKGYTIHDRLLRPALVKVLIPTKEVD